ncbi:Os12g0180850 [Oryza sativa Japonica Group]|uniref:Os12g0180850 protein n=2 Tax=Oryza sativa TaxID=4530 RepID=A0A0P0Y7S3_ORYSJ|nr:hypothetical protein OsI_37690 [Oryza sativa Indica Group]BAT16145.1 Os12g0180850 [Oryza sativa Japonica Group]
MLALCLPGSTRNLRLRTSLSARDMAVDELLTTAAAGGGSIGPRLRLLELQRWHLHWRRRRPRAESFVEGSGTCIDGGGLGAEESFARAAAVGPSFSAMGWPAAVEAAEAEVEEGRGMRERAARRRSRRKRRLAGRMQRRIAGG